MYPIDNSELDDLTSCLVTFQDTVQELLQLEQKLALQYNLTGSENKIHNRLVRMYKNDQLSESELLSNWEQSYASYVDWLQEGEKDVFR